LANTARRSDAHDFELFNGHKQRGAAKQIKNMRTFEA